MAFIWQKLATERAGIRRAKLVHVLWTLLWLRTYTTLPNLSAMCGVTPKTFRGKVWYYAASIARLSSEYVSENNDLRVCTENVIWIRWENRMMGDTGEKCHVTVDGTDFQNSRTNALLSKMVLVDQVDQVSDTRLRFVSKQVGLLNSMALVVCRTLRYLAC